MNGVHIEGWPIFPRTLLLIPLLPGPAPVLRLLPAVAPGATATVLRLLPLGLGSLRGPKFLGGGFSMMPVALLAADALPC
jgi:hypothetical protein